MHVVHHVVSCSDLQDTVCTFVHTQREQGVHRLQFQQMLVEREHTLQQHLDGHLL